MSFATGSRRKIVAGGRARLRRAFALGALLIFSNSMPIARAAEDNLALRVVILANGEDPDSLRIAHHYADVRGVPPQNIIALPLPLAETISWREFIVTLWQPLLEQLVATHWIDATPMALIDAIGRQKYAPYQHRIAALVVCRGVPLRINHDPALFSEVLPFTRRDEFRTNAGAVDAELSLLALPNYPINAFVPNPLFQNEKPAAADLAQVVKVARLDAPSVDDANALVDRAVVAERTGLLGRAYVDIANRDNLGDPWLASAAQQLRDLNFDVAIDRENGTFPVTARFDAPALYFGWYTGSIDGPFTLPGFRFPPGAIALHIHSYSAATLRNSTSGWTGPFVARGATATVGNVHEPYLQFTHQPHLLVRALARGWTLVDAAYFSLTALSWQAILIGDPLYRPFAVSLDDQVQDLARLPPSLAGYAVLRRMHELDDAKRPSEATAFAVSAQRDTPSLAVGVALAQRYRAAGEVDSAANALGFVPLLKSFEANEWALVREAAELLEACNRPARAAELWETLLATPGLPRELRVAWLPDAAKAARGAKNMSLALAWQQEHAKLTAAANP